MAVLSHYIQELLQRNDIAEVISQHVNIKRSGRVYKGLCPFHSERSPSFMVYPQTQSYYCFGCGAGGDVITFVKAINNLTYMEAVRFLAQQSGMPLPQEDDKQSRLKSRILEMNKLAARFFYDNLNSEGGKNARIYLRQRQLTDKTIVNFGIGYAQDSWQSLSDYLKSKGYHEEEITSAYLAAKSSKGNIYDIFRNRIMFPIIDLRGNVIAFGGRNLAEEGPKYLNSGDTPIFKKSNGLFALNVAKKAQKEKLILAEGYMDVIALHQAGFTNTIATLGTALTTQQVKLIGDYAKGVIIAYDSDIAGQKATQRAMELFSKEAVTVQVISMDGAKDPDEYIKKFGRDRFEMLLAGASSALDFELLRLRNQHDIKDIQGRVDYITKACTILAKINQPVIHDIYCGRLATETGTEKRSVLLQLDQAMKKFAKTQTIQRDKALLKEGIGANIKVDYSQNNTLSSILAQQQIMAAIMKDPDNFKLINKHLTQKSFTDKNMNSAFLAYSQLVAEGITPTYALLCHSLDDSARKDLAKINATNCDIIMSENDIMMHIDSILSAPMSNEDIENASLDEITQLMTRLREKKK